MNKRTQCPGEFEDLCGELLESFEREETLMGLPLELIDCRKVRADSDGLITRLL